MKTDFYWSTNLTDEQIIILDSLIDIAKDLVSILKGEDAKTYYSTQLKKVIYIEQVQEIINEAEQLQKNEQVVELESVFVKNTKKDIEILNKLREYFRNENI